MDAAGAEDGAVSRGRFRSILPRTPTQDAAARAVARASEAQPAMAPHQPTSARRPPTTSSERGKAFRARRRVYRGQLEEYLKVLQAEIRHLEERKDFMRTRQLQRRESATGSLVRLVREYYTIFQFGMGDRRRALVDPVYARRNASEVAYKENFLRSIMAEDANTGDLVGPDASLMQWHFFSAAHANLSARIDRVEVVGDPNDPFIDLHTTMNVVCGPHTLAMLFPGSEKNRDLVRKFETRRVAFPVLTRFKFGADGRICFEQVSSNLVEGYRRAGVALDDVVELFKHMIVSPSLTVKEDVAKSTANPTVYAQANVGATPRDDEQIFSHHHGEQFPPPPTEEPRSGRQHDRHWFIYEAES